MRLVLVLAVLLVAACGADGGDASDGSGGSGAVTLSPGTTGSEQADVRLTIVLDRSGEGDEQTYTLTCDPLGGDHPDPEAACAALEQAGVEAFAPVPPDVACTEIYGGPQTARVSGVVDGEQVDARFSRVNGCEISRWDALAPLLGSTGGVDT